MLKTLRTQIPRLPMGFASLSQRREIPEEHKSVMQIEGERKESWNLPDEDQIVQKKLSPRELKIEQDKSRMKWRRSFDEDETIWRSKFAVFSTNKNNMSFMMMMQQPWDFSPKNLKRIYSEFKFNKESYEQGFIEQRLKVLGPDLALAHFLTHRNGKVRFTEDPKWYTKEDNLTLPRTFDPKYFIESVNFDNQHLHFEGVIHFRELIRCKSISLRNCKYFNDWGLDRLSGCDLPCLEELDISGTDITSRCCGVFYRFTALKRLIIDKENKDSIEWQLIFAMLEEMNPNLEILDSKVAAQT